MKTKTIKLNEKEYTNFTNEFIEHDVVILTGARGSGKSYPTAKYIKKMLIEDTESKFIYMRIRNEELSTFLSWCDDLDLNEISNNSFSVTLKRGNPTRGDILLLGYNENGDEIFSRIIGKCVSLESAHTFKSGKYDEFKALVFEEYTHITMNPVNEKRYVFNFLENVVSIFRERDKKIFLLCNNLKNIPLLDRSIDELTGDIFKNPIKIKIFRKSKNKTTNNFLSYLNGELYDDEKFSINMSEFRIIYVNKDYTIYNHLIYNKKYYITANKINRTKIYNSYDYLDLKLFCQSSSSNEFYYQNSTVEKNYIKNYDNLIKEITLLLATKGRNVFR